MSGENIGFHSKDASGDYSSGEEANEMKRTSGCRIVLKVVGVE